MIDDVIFSDGLNNYERNTILEWLLCIIDGAMSDSSILPSKAPALTPSLYGAGRAYQQSLVVHSTFVVQSIR